MTTAARIDELRKKFDENPRRYFAPLANELRKAGELPQAIALCREHLPKQPGHMSGYIVFGQALFESGELGEARAVFEQALALDPENLIALRHLGDIARRQGDPVLARRWYERVLDADPRNDDIAAQLATLATPAVPMPAVAASSTPTPAYAVPPIMLGTLPTPDAAMRAVDIGAIPLRAPEPLPLLDLDAIEAVGDATEAANESSSDMAVAEVEPPASAAVNEVIETPVDETEAVSVAAVDEATEDTAEEPEDDPFVFAAMPSGGSPEPDVDAVVDVDAEFEEGLAAPEWPDTASLVARLGTPRSVTPVAVDIPVEAVEAFGREPQDPVVVPAVAPAPEPIESVPTDVVDAPVAEVVDAAVSDEIEAAPEEAMPDTAVDTPAAIDGVSEFDVELEKAAAPEAEAPAFQAFADHEVDAVEAPEAAAPEATVFAAEAVDTDVFTTEVTEAELFSAADEVEEMVTSAADDDELPWLAASPEASAPSDEVTEFAEALEADARAHGEAEEVAVEDRSAWEATPIEASFADVMPEADDDEMDALAAAGSDADAAPAFVTETMAELLVAQGLTGQAVSVYEELVRRRPYDPVLSSRLAELQEMLAPAPVAATAPVLPEFTARERFARLAARRALRGTPARPALAIDAPGDESLSALFGTEPMPQEDVAARTLAAAFAPVTEAPEAAIGASLFSATPAAGVARQHTPLRPMTPLRAATPIASPAVPSGGDFSFDRFFPDPATASRPPVPGSDETGGRETPSAGAPSASDDLSQFSAWLKGLGNS